MQGRAVGSKGYAGLQRTDNDEDLARRRFEKFNELTRELDPGSYCFEDILPLLPLDGGSPLACGDTRFFHAQEETCTHPGATGDKCSRVLRNGLKCSRPLGHKTKCMSRASKETRKKTDRERRARERRTRETQGATNAMD
jgi:hypothetical protein